MSKIDLVDAVAAKTGSTRAVASRAVDAVLATIGEGLRREGKFRIPKFGSFSVSAISARTGRNPLTGQPVEIPAKRRVVFKAGSELRASMATEAGGPRASGKAK